MKKNVVDNQIINIRIAFERESVVTKIAPADKSLIESKINGLETAETQAILFNRAVWLLETAVTINRYYETMHHIDLLYGLILRIEHLLLMMAMAGPNYID